MSYILDALRKADAQRERDASRGIHAQGASLGATAAEPDTGKRAGCLALVAAAVVLAVGAGWYFSSRQRAPAAVVMAPAPNAIQPPAAATISPPPPAPVAPPSISPAPLQAREAAFTARGTAPAVPAAPEGGATPATSAPSAAPAAPITGGLPADAPKVAISGGVYSPNPAQRMLIVNGQVFNEGSEVAPGVKVDAILARTAVLVFRGARYTVAY